jgi:hypothetical protein
MKLTKKYPHSHEPALLIGTNMANHVTTIKTKKRETVKEFTFSFAIALGVILLAGAITRTSEWYLDEQKANRAALDSGPLKSNYTARAGDR